MDARHDALQRRLGHRFAQPALLEQSLTHRSFGSGHNERLEFLGDAVLGAAVSSLLFRHFAGSDEGDLTRVRAHLVRQDTLHQLALKLGLHEMLRLSEGEARSGGAHRPSLLADAFEAVVGAIFLDGGFESARSFVEQSFAPLVSGAEITAWAKDAKTALQEWLQGRKLALPAYTVAATHGRQHEQIFVVECRIANPPLTVQGDGRSRRAAEQAAAQAALEQLEAGVASGRG